MSDRFVAFTLSPAGQYTSGIMLALVAIIGLMALFTYLQETTEEITVQIPFTHRAEFRYHAPAVITEETLGAFIEDEEEIKRIVNAVYGGELIQNVEDLDAHTGEPIFPRIHPILDIQIEYTLEGPPEASVQGFQEYVSTLKDVTGWRQDFPIISSEPFFGHSSSVSFDLRMRPTFDSLEAFESITGHVPRQYSGTIFGYIDTTVTYLGQTVTDRFEPSLKYLFDPPTEAFLDSKEYSSFAYLNQDATNVDETPVVDTKTFSIPIPQIVETDVTILGVTISISDARMWTLVTLPIPSSLLALVIIGSLMGNKRSEDFRIRARFGTRLITAAAADPTAVGRTMDLASIDDLMKVSNQMQLPVIRSVIHATEHDSVIFSVNDRDIQYLYRPGDRK